jgi:hypothetical protein
MMLRYYHDDGGGGGSHDNLDTSHSKSYIIHFHFKPTFSYLTEGKTKLYNLYQML